MTVVQAVALTGFAARAGRRAILARVGVDTSATAAERRHRDVALSSLLAAVAEGDQASFGRLYDEMSARVYGLIRRVLIDDSQADEVLQEVFLEVWQTAPRFSPERGSAISWIFTMAHRRAVDRVRATQSRRNRDSRIAERDREPAYDPVAEAGDTHIESERVRRAMTELSDAQREAIALAYYGGRTQTEIADLLGLPVGTVKTRLRDGMIRLRALLGVRS